MAITLDQEVLKKGLRHLKIKDPDLKVIIRNLKGDIPFFKRDSNFRGLVNLIIEQQLSIASARAIFNRLNNILDSFTPKNFLKLNEESLQKIGLSRQKVLYCITLANACCSGEMDFSAIKKMSNEDAIQYLTKLKGIGNWTAQCYLLGALGRRDAWPSSDLGLQIAIQRIKGLDKKPNVLTTEQIAEPWRPYRGVAALVLWSTYDV